MCNLYSVNKTREEIRQLVKALHDLNNNQPPLPGVYPDYEAPIVRMENGERIMSNARWGLPSPAFALQGRNSDSGITNVRNTSSGHWKRWLGPANRCLVPLKWLYGASCCFGLLGAIRNLKFAEVKYERQMNEPFGLG